MLTKENLLNKLKNSGYNFSIYEHEALYSVEDSIGKRGLIHGSHSKNLFLKNKKNQFYLFSCLEEASINLKKLSNSLGLGNISFAKESYLLNYLGVKPGSVTPFGLLNDLDNKVSFYFDSSFLKNKTINFHPLVNTSTINLKTDDFINFLIENNKNVNIFDFNEYSIIR
jgi:Ala-tRNA(Pro) deacylase